MIFLQGNLSILRKAVEPHVIGTNKINPIGNKQYNELVLGV
jgi:hypothetical protein